MRQLLLRSSVVAIASVLTVGGVSAVRVIAQDATPSTSPVTGATTIVLVEHNDNETNVDLGETGPSAGDLRVWGPNPLYDAANTADSGATTQGTCVAMNAANDCLLNETVLFPDGSTLELHGIQLGGGVPSTRTIVGGSGQYLGASGFVAVAPTEDERYWAKTFEITMR